MVGINFVSHNMSINKLLLSRSYCSLLNVLPTVVCVLRNNIVTEQIRIDSEAGQNTHKCSVRNPSWLFHN